ncbi:hypothetical protein HDU76_010113 [Blyttiomyces sp. JEL0837]|nr:hypothetical protein HDU76_010113 [Blyttiomyces sp. JEL0837]
MGDVQLMHMQSEEGRDEEPRSFHYGDQQRRASVTSRNSRASSIKTTTHASSYIAETDSCQSNSTFELMTATDHIERLLIINKRSSFNTNNSNGPSKIPPTSFSKQSSMANSILSSTAEYASAGVGTGNQNRTSRHVVGQISMSSIQMQPATSWSISRVVVEGNGNIGSGIGNIGNNVGNKSVAGSTISLRQFLKMDIGSAGGGAEQPQIQKSNIGNRANTIVGGGANTGVGNGVTSPVPARASTVSSYDQRRRSVPVHDVEQGHGHVNQRRMSIGSNGGNGGGNSGTGQTRVGVTVSSNAIRTTTLPRRNGALGRDTSVTSMGGNGHHGNGTARESNYGNGGVVNIVGNASGAVDADSIEVNFDGSGSASIMAPQLQRQQSHQYIHRHVEPRDTDRLIQMLKDSVAGVPDEAIKPTSKLTTTATTIAASPIDLNTLYDPTFLDERRQKIYQELLLTSMKPIPYDDDHNEELESSEFIFGPLGHMSGMNWVPPLMNLKNHITAIPPIQTLPAFPKATTNPQMHTVTVSPASLLQSPPQTETTTTATPMMRSGSTEKRSFSSPTSQLLPGSVGAAMSPSTSGPAPGGEFLSSASAPVPVEYISGGSILNSEDIVGLQKRQGKSLNQKTGVGIWTKLKRVFKPRRHSSDI